MPQGGKLKTPAGNPHKAKSTTQKKQQPKKGRKSTHPLCSLTGLSEQRLTFTSIYTERNIPPKKAAAVTVATTHRKNTSSHASAQEGAIAAQAMSHGKLTIMRQAAEKVKKQNDNGK